MVDSGVVTQVYSPWGLSVELQGGAPSAETGRPLGATGRMVLFSAWADSLEGWDRGTATNTFPPGEEKAPTALIGRKYMFVITWIKRRSGSYSSGVFSHQRKSPKHSTIQVTSSPQRESQLASLCPGSPEDSCHCSSGCGSRSEWSIWRCLSPEIQSAPGTHKDWTLREKK